VRGAAIGTNLVILLSEKQGFVPQAGASLRARRDRGFS
jgi:hypothetical protein